MPVIQFTVNKAAYEALSPAHKTILDVWYRAMIDDLRMRNEVSDREIVARDKAAGVEVIDWPQAERDKFRTIAEAAWKDYAQGDPMVQKAYEAQVAFMRRIGLLER
jgi:TRAP-type C4-dicarboxylate transport system substrate-binding protein